MKRLKLFFACLLMAVLSIGQVWGAEGDVVYTLNTAASSIPIATSNSYGNYADATNNWKVTCGAKQSDGLWLGSNNNQKTKMILSNGSYSEGSAIATALGIQASATYYAAIIGTSELENVGKVTLTYTTPGGTAPSEAWICYSTNSGSTWSIAKRVATLSTSGTDFEFDETIESARYAFVIHCTGYCQFKVPVLTFYEGATEAPSTPYVSVDPDALSFGTVEQNASVAAKTFSVTGSNLTGAITITSPNAGFTVTPASITPTDGAIAATDVTVTPVTTAANTFDGNVVISGGGLENNVTVALTMTVAAPVAVTEVTLDEDAISLEIGKNKTLTATVAPEEATNKNVTWESSDNAVATVDNGVVTAVAVGNATITCKSVADNTITATCAVTVTEHVVTPGTYSITPNTTFWGCSDINKSNATENEINYTGSQNDITITIKNGKKQNAYINSTQTRVYSDGYTMAFSVPSGYNITAIVFTADGSNWAGTHTASVGTMTDNKHWSGKANSVTITFGGTCRINGISVTYEAIAPEVTVDPASLSFTAKQNIAVDGKTFTLEGANLTSGLTLAASTGFSVSPTSLTAEAAMVEGGVEVTVTPATPTTTTTPVEGTVTISGDCLASDVVVNLSMAVTPTYAVAIAVNDGDMGSATINGGTAAVYVTDDEEIALVATPAEHHEFVNWTVSDENIVLGNANNATTTALAAAAGTITANFQQQACQALAAPVLDEITKTYQSATIAWNAVTNAEGYVLNITKHEDGSAVLTNELIVVPEVSFEKTGLEANTRYDYTVMAIGDGTDYCDANNPVLESYFTTDDYPAATLSLVENGGTPYNWGSDLKLNSVIALPEELAGLGCTGKVLVGWDADENCATAPTYAKGADYTIASTADVLYAVFATEQEQAGSEHSVFATTSLGTTSTVTDGYTITKQGENKSGYVQDGSGTAGDSKYVQVKVTNTATQIIPEAPTAITVKATIGGGATKDPLDNSVYAVLIDANQNAIGDPVLLTTKVTATTGSEFEASMPIANYANVRGARVTHAKENSYNVRYYAISLSYTTGGGVSYSGYTTECDAQLPKLDAPTFPVAEGVFYESTDITISAADGASIYYTTDGTTPSSTNGTLYEGAITLNAYGTYNFKAVAIQAGHEDSEVAEATYYFGQTFASVSDLYSYLEANSLTSMNNVKVTGLVSRITAAWDAQKGYLTYYISDNGVAENDLQMYRGAGEGASALAVGDQVTVTGNYTLFQSTTHEFGAGNTIVARTAATVASVEIGGAASKTVYSLQDNVFSHAGLTATATYNTGYTKDVTALATWTNNLENNTVAASGNVEVTATYEGESDTKEVAVTYTSKTLDHITLSYTSTTAYVGMALPTPTVTASYVEDIDDEDVTELVAAANGFDTESAYNGSAAGSYTINVSYTLGEVTKSAEYTVTVKSIYNDVSDPYTVAEALDIIGANFNTTTASADSIVVAGIVSRLDGTYVNTYWISDDGNTNNELEVYSGKYLNKVAFTAANQLHVGDEVVVIGKVKTYQSTKEFDSNSRLVSVIREPEFAIANIVAVDEFEANFSDDMEVVPTANSGDAEFTLTSGNEEAVTIVNGKLHAVAEGDAEITASRAATNNANALNYKAKEITFNVHVIAERTRYTVTFDANGGEGTDPEAIANQLAGATVDMPAACLYNKAGHGFTGWKVINLSTEAEIEVENDQFVMPESNVKIQAQWAVVATCAISFQVGGQEVATANAPQDADYNIPANTAHPTIDGFTFLGWSETEYADEVETVPTLINVYHAQAGEETKTLYGIYSRLEDNGNQHYVLDYTTDGVADLITAAYGNAVNVTATDGGQWVVKAYKNAGMQINTGKNGSIKVPSCPGNIVSIGITCSVAKSVGFSTSDYSGSGTITYVVYGTDATSQTLNFAGEEVKDGYIVPKGGSTAITHIDVEYSSVKTYYTSSPVEKVTVTFALAGGEGGCQTTKINKGSQLTICAEVPTKSHSEFTGWKNGETIYEAGQAYTFDADITLTAQWNPLPTYTITYDVNGGSGAAPTQADQYAGDNFTIAAGVTLEGYTFKGWEYNNKLYKAGKTFTMPAEDITFVANWKKDAVATEKMTLITDAAALVDGLEFALGCSYGESNFAMAGDLGSNSYFASASGDNITLSNGLASFTSDVIILIAEKTEGGWKLRKDATNYLKETSVKNLAWGTSADATVWTISFSEGNVVIESADNTMKFNKDYPRFTTYASGQTAIQLFGKATVVSSPDNNPVNISDLGNVSGETVVVTSGTTLVANEESAPEGLVIQEGAKYVAQYETHTPVVHFSVTMGSENVETTASEIENALNIILTTGGEIHYDITLGTSMEGTQADPNQWHAFTVPFPCDALNGIYNAETGAKLTNEVDYAIMDYHGDIRANGQYGWKKFRGTLVPGTFYIMTVTGDVKTFRFKKAAVGALPNHTSKDVVAYSGTGQSKDQGWNGIGNPSWLGGKVGYDVQVLDPYSYTFVTKYANTTNFKPGTPFFYKAGSTSPSSIVMAEANASANYAPARTPADEIKNLIVRFGNEVFVDKLCISANEDALNAYEQDKDLVKMTMTNTPKVAQIFGDAYGMKLSMVNTPLVNNNAEVALTLYAPAAGEYTISIPEVEDYQVYLLRDGAVIWNLSASEYTAEFAKGNNDGYGIRIVKAPKITTDVDNIYDKASGVQKVVMDNNVFILRAGQMFDVTGKMVK